MKPVSPRWSFFLATGLIASCAGLAQAHDFKAGDITIDHPYATPTLPAATTGAVYFRGLKNAGAQPDRLIGARSPVARSVETHEMHMDGDLMRMRAVPALEIPAKGEVSMRHGGQYHLMLTDLSQPLKQGDRFPITLEFERGGKKEVMVWVQQPRELTEHHHH
ncbi:MAG: copper chaperone PCu(A)C [Leptothrix sp. (in: b-proteobacteria)]